MTLIRHFLFCQTLFLTSSDLNFCQLSYNRPNTPFTRTCIFSTQRTHVFRTHHYNLTITAMCYQKLDIYNIACKGNIIFIRKNMKKFLLLEIS